MSEKLNFDFTVSSLAAYNDQLSMELFYKKYLVNTIYSTWMPVPTNATDTYLPTLTPSITFNTDACEITAAGSQVFTQRKLETTTITSKQKMCKKDLSAKYMSAKFKTLLSNEEIPFLDEITNASMQVFLNQFEKGKYEGTGNSDSVYRMKGLFAVLSGDTAVKSINTFVPALSARTGLGDLSVTGISSTIETAYQLLPSEAQGAMDLVLYLSSTEFFKLAKNLAVDYKYIQILTTNNMKSFQHPFISNLTVINDINMTASKFVMTPLSNIYASHDLSGKETEIKYVFDEVNDNYIQYIKMVAGVQVAVPEWVVTNIAVV
jgi:hypothetical protein